MIALRKVFFKFDTMKDILETLSIFSSTVFFLARMNARAKVGGKKKRNKKQDCGCFELQSAICPRSHLCVYQHGRVRRVSVSPIRDIYLDAFFFARRACGLSVKRLLLWLSVRCTAIQMSVRGTFDQADLRTWSVRGQFPSYPLWSFACKDADDSRSAVRIDTFDYWR